MHSNFDMIDPPDLEEMNRKVKESFLLARWFNLDIDRRYQMWVKKETESENIPHLIKQERESLKLYF